VSRFNRSKAYIEEVRKLKNSGFGSWPHPPFGVFCEPWDETCQHLYRIPNLKFLASPFANLRTDFKILKFRRWTLITPLLGVFTVFCHAWENLKFLASPVPNLRKLYKKDGYHQQNVRQRQKLISIMVDARKNLKSGLDPADHTPWRHFPWDETYEGLSVY